MKAPFLTAAIFLVAGLSTSMAGIRPAAAADAKSSFAVHGIGASNCKDLNTIPAANVPQVRSLLASWILGYVTAVDRIQANTYDVTPVQDQSALVNMVANVCAKHPEARVESVTYAVLQSLKKAKLTSPSPEVAVTVGRQTTVLRQTTLEELQKILVKLAYLPSHDVTGAFSTEMQIALVKFQAAKHLPQTGLPDPATVVRALVETP